MAVMSIASIGMLSATFLGVNHIALAAATSGTHSLPPIAATNVSDSTTSQTSNSTFLAPTLTVTNPFQQYRGAVPSYALPMDEAAQLGANYIWDVFEESIDGMYVQMQFISSPGQTRTLWLGVVSENCLSTSAYFRGESSRLSALPSYQFTIDGITGERLDLIQFNRDQFSSTPRTSRPIEADMQFRESIVDSGWFDKNASEQIVYLGLSPDYFDEYKQKARTIAEGHFNLTTITSFDLNFVMVDWERAANDEIELIPSNLRFAAVDDTGREAIITLTVGNGFINISTSHNDFIPGFTVDGSRG